MTPSALFLVVALTLLPGVAKADPNGNGMPTEAEFDRNLDAAIRKESGGDFGKAEKLVDRVGEYRPFIDQLVGAADDPAARAKVIQGINAKFGADAQVVTRVVFGVVNMDPPTVGNGPGGGTGDGGDLNNPPKTGSGEVRIPDNKIPNHASTNNGTTAPTPSVPNEISNIPSDKRQAAAVAGADFNPTNPGVQYGAAVTLFRTGDAQGAFDYATKAINLKRDSPSLTIAAQSAAKLGDLELANKLAAEALAMDPSNKTAGIVKELTANRASRIKLGGTLAKNGLAAPGSAPALESLAAGLAGQGMGQGGGAGGAVTAGAASGQVTAAQLAALAAQQANIPASNERQSKALAREAATRIGIQEYEAAVAVASQAIELNPRNAQAYTYRAQANAYLSKFKDAVFDASYALTLVPNNAPALQTRSWAFNKQKLYKESLADANATIEVDPNNAQAYYNASWAYAGMGDKPKAMTALKLAADKSPIFKPTYEMAIQAPEDADLLLLFQDRPVFGSAGAPAGGSRKRALRFILLSLIGGLLTALAVLHVVSAGWREKVNATIRRALGGATEAGVAAGPSGTIELAGAAPAGSQGIWAQYTPVRTLGQGGMGIVYEAVDRSLDRTVAVKKMRDELKADPAERQRFISEARMVAALRHPNLVEIYSIVEDSQDVYLVFEYVPGKTLSEQLKDGPMEVQAARQILAGACAAVEHAHKNNVIHRDLKPSNIMMGQGGECKVMDFGVARQAKDAMTKMALTNTIVGTPPYMAPEQEQGSVRKESDVFALGVCFYEMLTGELPFGGHGAGMLLNKINGRHAPLSQKARVKVTPELDAVMAKALAGDPDKRYRTPSEFLAAVDACLGAPARA